MEGTIYEALDFEAAYKTAKGYSWALSRGTRKWLLNHEDLCQVGMVAWSAGRTSARAIGCAMIDELRHMQGNPSRRG